MADLEFEEFEPERLVKSSERVRDLGEVYTPANIVDDMLDLFPAEVWQVHPSRTFLEPAVGNGNFISAILSRKLSVIDSAFKDGTLPSGTLQESAEFHALEALSSIYGVDISEENIIGGTPGHEIACRPRLIEILRRWHIRIFKNVSSAGNAFLESAQWIVDHNMIIGNMLERDGDGKPTLRDEIPIIEYSWDASNRTVRLARSTYGDIHMAAEEEQSDVLSLFGAAQPTELWNGPFLKLHAIKREAQVALLGAPASNSRGKK